MISPAYDLALFLQGLPEFGPTIYVSREPATPDDVTTIYDTGGPASGTIDIDLRSPTIQIRVRGRDYNDAYARQEAIYKALGVDRTSFETANARYIGCWLTSEIISIGRDDNDRFLLTANYQIERQPLEV